MVTNDNHEMQRSGFLIAIIALAFVPPFIGVLVPSETIVSIAGTAWLVAAILYCFSVKRKSSLWVFVLLPIVFGPFVYELLIIVGVWLSGGQS
jgi:hypothetical protein